MTSAYGEIIGALVRHRGVVAALVALESDGIAIAAQSQVGVECDALAALGASLHRRARMANLAAGFGTTRLVRLDAAHGQLFVAGRDDLVLIVLAEGGANVGLLRVAIQRGAEALS